MTKLPESSGYLFDQDTANYTEAAYTKAQLKQYGDDRAREALKDAETISMKYTHPIAGLIGHEIWLLAKETT